MYYLGRVMVDDKGFNLLDECTTTCVHLSPQDEGVHLFVLKGTVKWTHLAT